MTRARADRELIPCLVQAGLVGFVVGAAASAGWLGPTFGIGGLFVGVCVFFNSGTTRRWRLWLSAAICFGYGCLLIHSDWQAGLTKNLLVDIRELSKLPIKETPVPTIGGALLAAYAVFLIISDAVRWLGRGSTGRLQS